MVLVYVGVGANGARTRIVVPPSGLESMEIVPFMRRTRSNMLLSPMPPDFSAL